MMQLLCLLIDSYKESICMKRKKATNRVSRVSRNRTKEIPLAYRIKILQNAEETFKIYFTI